VFENRVLRKTLGPNGMRQQGSGEDYITVFLTKYYSGDQIKKNEIGGARGTYGSQDRCMHDLGA
jgi:hypothetical protein